MPALNFRNGLILNHGEYDDPLLLLDEVFVKRLYDLKTNAPQDGIMVDVGANIGSVTEFFALESTTLRIHAYEPNPAAFEMLRRNIKDNHLEQRVIALPEAVGRESGDLSLWVDVNTTLSTAYMQSSPDEGGRRITVPMVGLDEVWRRLDEAPIWLLKIDTEGAEGDILEGAAQTTLGAVQNAIIDAVSHLGIRHIDMPASPQRVWQAMQSASASTAAGLNESGDA